MLFHMYSCQDLFLYDYLLNGEKDILTRKDSCGESLTTALFLDTLPPCGW